MLCCLCCAACGVQPYDPDPAHGTQNLVLRNVAGQGVATIRVTARLAKDMRLTPDMLQWLQGGGPGQALQGSPGPLTNIASPSLAPSIAPTTGYASPHPGMPPRSRGMSDAGGLGGAVTPPGLASPAPPSYVHSLAPSARVSHTGQATPTLGGGGPAAPGAARALVLGDMAPALPPQHWACRIASEHVSAAQLVVQLQRCAGRMLLVLCCVVQSSVDDACVERYVGHDGPLWDRTVLLHGVLLVGGDKFICEMQLTWS